MASFRDDHLPRNLRRSGGSAACLLLLSMLLAAPLSLACAQTPAKNFGDWRFRCETPAGAQNEQCVLQQSIVADDHPELTLLVAVRVVGGKLRLLRVVAPLGVVLTRGLGLRIDKTDMGKASFTRCWQEGCVADVEMDDTLADLLKKGQVATFIVFKSLEEGVGIPVSLEGFAEGLEALR